MAEKCKGFVNRFGIPRIIIVAFFLLLAVTAKAYNMNMAMLFSDAIRRWGMYGILVLAMVPAVQCGIGLNFGVSLGIVGGLLGALISIEMDVGSWAMFANASDTTIAWVTFLIATVIAIFFATFIGIGYGIILNKVKGSEMTVSTYVGFSAIAVMNIAWLSLPFTSGQLIWPVGGEGLRNTIDLSSSFGKVLNNTLSFSIFGVEIPTGLLLFFFIACYIVWLFLRTKPGMAMSAGGTNPVFAKASGIDVDKTRILGTAISTILGAVGIIAYAQGYGFLQLYNGPMMMGFACVAAVLIGGASTAKATIANVVLGAFLFQGLLAFGLPVANQIIPEGNLSEVMRLIVSNGIILYALTKAGGNK